MARDEKFTLENLKLLDFGKIGVAFETELQHVVRDCGDRPADDRPRSIKIEFKIAPVFEPENDKTHAEEVKVGCEITSTLPKRRTKIYTMRPKADGTVGFHPDLPDEPEESTLYDEAGERQDRQK